MALADIIIWLRVEIPPFLFVKEDIESNTKYTETQIVQMLDFLIDNIFVECGRHIFQQIVDIPMGPNCAPLLAVQCRVHSKYVYRKVVIINL